VPQITPFLMFEGRADEAMSLYLSLFPDASVLSVSRYGEGEPGAAGTVRHAVFSLAGQRVQCIDSPVSHGFTFTPAFSLHVTFETEADLDRVYQALSEGGGVLMPLAAYPFSPKYAWLNDRFGVSWQLSLAG
jgi:predicted 3-demethylubiquinone-9 3-methyltransferase (glyoxalase superfamily)